jgi:hypothetical protein
MIFSPYLSCFPLAFQPALYDFFWNHFTSHAPAAVRSPVVHLLVLLQVDLINAELSALFDRFQAT